MQCEWEFALCGSLFLCSSFRLLVDEVSIFSITEQLISRRNRPVYEMPRKCNNMLARVVFLCACVGVVAHEFSQISVMLTWQVCEQQQKTTVVQLYMENVILIRLRTTICPHYTTIMSTNSTYCQSLPEYLIFCKILNLICHLVLSSVEVSYPLNWASVARR